jgi:hypothetical protein
MAKQITNIKFTSNKAQRHEVTPGHYRGHYLVTSGESHITYHVRLEPQPTCTCDWAKYQPAYEPVACSHVQAALTWVEAQDGYKAKFYPQSQDVSHHKRRTIRLGNGVQATARRVAPVKSSYQELSLEDANEALFG